MNKYEKQANDFLQATSTTLTIKNAGAAINETWGDGATRYKYRFTIKNAKGQYIGFFWGSINEYNNNERRITAYDILTSITKYDPCSFDDFVGEYGYTFDNMKEYNRARKIYQGVTEEWEAVKMLFNSDQIDALRDIE